MLDRSRSLVASFALISLCACEATAPRKAARASHTPDSAYLDRYADRGATALLLGPGCITSCVADGFRHPTQPEGYVLEPD